MPLPLAHPAAVLPLRRYCPRWLDLPALVIGSLVPDAGYAFGRFHLEMFSHRLLAGSFGFCLPMGLVLWLLLHWLHRPVVGLLPERQRRALEPCGRRRAVAPFGVVVSLLVGAWTHIILDSISHGNPALVEILPFLRRNIILGHSFGRVDDWLGAAFTFVGTFYVAITYLNWLEKKVRNTGWIFPGFKWVATMVVAALALLLSLASHDGFHTPGIVVLGMLTALLLAAFLLVTDRGLTKVSRKQKAKQVPADAGIKQT